MNLFNISRPPKLRGLYSLYVPLFGPQDTEPEGWLRSGKAAGWRDRTEITRTRMSSPRRALDPHVAIVTRAPR
ncbi:hypothetical protein EVAR_24284_1 [Eumeta japonica]|uniref:Uncharacterized protein n=1 Tax=Eumeta variegata TaxID=151549 RepID=A0A4C1VFR0_EUMVA|nr:hypothetical protein EVAR_24284_1 [Eumeta japonica]